MTNSRFTVIDFILSIALVGAIVHYMPSILDSIEKSRNTPGTYSETLSQQVQALLDTRTTPNAYANTTITLVSEKDEPTRNAFRNEGGFIRFIDDKQFEISIPWRIPSATIHIDNTSKVSAQVSPLGKQATYNPTFPTLQAALPLLEKVRAAQAAFLSSFHNKQYPLHSGLHDAFFFRDGVVLIRASFDLSGRVTQLAIHCRELDKLTPEQFVSVADQLFEQPRAEWRW